MKGKMEKNAKLFVELAKMTVNQAQKVSQVDLKSVNELPGHMLYIYTDTVLLKSNYKSIENQLETVANKLNLQVAIQAPRSVSGVSMKKLSPLKRFILIAIYQPSNLQVSN